MTSTNGLPVESTQLGIIGNVIDDDRNKIIIVESDQPPMTTPMAERIYFNLDTTLSHPLKRAKRHFVHRPLFVYRQFHRRNRTRKPGDDHEDNDRNEEEPKSKRIGGHQYLRKRNRSNLYPGDGAVN